MEIKFNIEGKEIKEIILDSLREAIRNDFKYIAEDGMFEGLEDVLSGVIEDMKDEIKNELLKDKKIRAKIKKEIIEIIKDKF